jgi:hypothetical protein
MHCEQPILSAFSRKRYGVANLEVTSNDEKVNVRPTLHLTGLCDRGVNLMERSMTAAFYCYAQALLLEQCRLSHFVNRTPFFFEKSNLRPGYGDLRRLRIKSLEIAVGIGVIMNRGKA